MKKFDPIIYVEDDGLITPEIGIWGLQKYKLLGMYCDIFTAGMKNKWENLVYLDLFAGAGHAKFKNENKRLQTSSLIAASIPTKFTKYIMCEFEAENIQALETRFNKDHKELQRIFIPGDSNKNIKNIVKEIPGVGNTLSFCFVDPFSLNLEFETIKSVANHGRVDFLILLALQMDARRNFHNYIREESSKIDKFLGNPNWRKPFENGEIRQKDFIRYLAEYYDQNMKQLGYVVNPRLKFQIKNDHLNMPIYYLAFYSKHERGNDFCEKIEKYQQVQLKMF